jgi:calcium-dependent protein kinase
VSPEIIKGSYDDKCDIWAIGVLTYLLLCGDPPFGGLDGPGQDLNAVRAKILKGAVDFEPKEIWSTISLKAKKFILNLLVMDPPRRPTAAGAQEHSWLLEFAPNQDHEARLDPKVVKALVSFKELSVVKRLLLEVLSYTLLPEQVNGLQAEFQKLDVDRSGEISLPAMKSILVSDIENPAEIENIFNAIKLGKSQSRIHWHEFLAGCISCCHVDERNIHLAFERLDRNHCGYITLDNVVDLMARDANQEVLRITWEEIVEEFKCRQARFTYDEFRGMMEKCLQET